MDRTGENTESSVGFLRPEVAKAENYIERILEVSPKPMSCTKTMQCERQGACILFDVQFKLLRENRGKHLVKIGLRSGTLRLRLDPLHARRLHPKNEIKPTVVVEQISVDSFTTKLSVADPTISDEHGKRVTSPHAWLRVSSGGTPKEPCWFFEAYRDELFNGTAEDLTCEIRPEARACCRYTYEFVIKEGDWSYDTTIHPKTRWLGGKFAQLKLRAYCEKRIRRIHSNVTSELSNIIARGRWICSAKK